MTKRFSAPLLTAIALVISSFTVAAQPSSMQRDTLDARIYFRQGISSLEPGFRNNGRVLAAFCSDVNRILADSSLTVYAVTVETGASPEGGVEYNERLAMERARSIRRYLVDNLPLSASQIKAWSSGIDWEGLTRLVRLTANPWREEILDVIARSGVRLAFDGRADARCKEELMAVDGGKAWAWMNEEIFPELRHGAGTLRCIVIPRGELERVRDTVVIIHDFENNEQITVSDLDSVRRVATDEAVRRVYDDKKTKAKGYRNDSLWRVPVAAIRTNILLPALNVGAEMPLGNRWSVAADVYYPWIWRRWMNRFVSPQKECVEGLVFSAEGRVWFGELHGDDNGSAKWRLTGHSLGVVLMGGYGDYCHNYIGYQGEAFAAALSYIYSLPLGRRARAHLEFEVAAGWAYAQWRGYEVHGGDTRLIGNYNDGRYSGPAPLRVAVSLSFPLFGKE